MEFRWGSQPLSIHVNDMLSMGNAEVLEMTPLWPLQERVYGKVMNEQDVSSISIKDTGTAFLAKGKKSDNTGHLTWV